MGWENRYPSIANLETMKPSPRILLGKRLLWTIKEDGSCMAMWMKDGLPHLSSRNLVNASSDLESLVKRSEDYQKLLELLQENPQFIIYFEACPKGRSITGIKEYERDIMIIFDVFDSAAKKFLPYVLVHQNAFHHKIPVVKLYAETRHRTMKDLLKFKNHVYEHCLAIKEEGMVIKTYTIPEQYKRWEEFKGGMIQAKVKIDIPEPVKRKISKGEPIYPIMPDADIMGAIDKVWQELGTEKFKDVKTTMPLVAKAIEEECTKHFYSSPKRNFFSYYKEYLSRLT